MTLSSGIELPSDRISEICKRYGVRELAVFGSAACGDLRPESDVDILVDSEPDARIGLVKFASLSEELEGLVGHVFAQDQRISITDFLKRQKIVLLIGDPPPDAVDHAKVPSFSVGFEVLLEDALGQPR